MGTWRKECLYLIYLFFPPCFFLYCVVLSRMRYLLDFYFVIAGTFDGWTGRIPLNKSEKDFTLIANLPPGPYQYKFIVDGKWRYAPDLPTTTDHDGNVNNTIEVKELPKAQEHKLGGSCP